MSEELHEELRSSQPTAIAERPLLLFLTGAPGAGKNTFYESKLRESFPILLKLSSSPLEQAELEWQRGDLLKARRSFVFQSSVVDMDLLNSARSHGFEIKVIFIGTEHPDLNIARILFRVSRGGLFGPIATLHEEYESGIHQLKALAKAADELLLLDNSVEGRGHRVIARFVHGEALKIARSLPGWAEKYMERFQQRTRERAR